MTSLTFRECTLHKLDNLFGLREVEQLEPLEAWLARQPEITEFEEKTLRYFQSHLRRNVHDWNEFELGQNFIGPVLALVNFTTNHFNLFAEREFSGTVQDVTLTGAPDGMIASGRRSPQKPYFCFQEYKRLHDPKGDPVGQCLAAMLVAQELNEYKHPIYGCYITGADWSFMALTGKTYAITPPQVATREDIFTVFRTLKALKQIIIELIGQQVGQSKSTN